MPHCYYGGSDSCASARGSSAHYEHEHRPLPAAQVSLLHVHGLPIIPSPPTWQPPASLFHATLQRAELPPCCSRSGLRHWIAGSSICPAVSSSLSYGLVVHLPLLRTSPFDDALTFDYRPESACLTRTRTSLSMHARRRTIPAFAGMTVSRPA